MPAPCENGRSSTPSFPPASVHLRRPPLPFPTAPYGQASFLVRNGKGHKTREMFIPEDLKRHLKTFITWKCERGEDATDAAPLFTGQRV